MKHKLCPEHGKSVDDWDSKPVQNGKKWERQWWKVEVTFFGKRKKVGDTFLCTHDHTYSETPTQALEHLKRNAYEGKSVECPWHSGGWSLRKSRIPHELVQSPKGNSWLLHQNKNDVWGCCKYDHSDMPE